MTDVMADKVLTTDAFLIKRHLKVNRTVPLSQYLTVYDLRRVVDDLKWEELVEFLAAF